MFRQTREFRANFAEPECEDRSRSVPSDQPQLPFVEQSKRPIFRRSRSNVSCEISHQFIVGVSGFLVIRSQAWLELDDADTARLAPIRNVVALPTHHLREKARVV